MSVAADPYSILIADPDASERSSLHGLLEEAGFQVIEAATGEEVLKIVRRRRPSVVILEVPLGRLSGYEVCRALRQTLGADLGIIFVSGSRTESYDRVAGLLLGADDYVTKPYAGDELLARIRGLDLRVRRVSAPSLVRLTPREREVLRLLAEGSSPDEIAARFFISTKTVASHVEHILTKLNVNSRVQAVAVAYREGLIDAPTA